MDDNRNQITEDIKWILFDDRNFEASFNFVGWAYDENSFIVKGDDGEKYRVTVTKEGI